MSDKTLSFTQRSLAEALDNVRCLSDLGPELIAEQVFAASAQQPAQAVPDGWKLVPFHATREQVNAVFMHPDLARTLYRNMVEAAPAAPVAQEPVAWSDGQCREFVSVALRHVEVKGALHAQDIRDGLEYMACRGAGIPMVLGMPPAAEQPEQRAYACPRCGASIATPEPYSAQVSCRACGKSSAATAPSRCPPPSRRTP